MSDINWDEAPEGATHWDSDADVFCEVNGYWREGDYIHFDDQYGWGTDRYITKPDIKPSKPVTLSSIYKKEEFEFTDKSGEHTIKSKHILCCADTGRVVAVFYNERDLIAATGLTKKVELVDGKAYQFDARDKGGIVCGIYNDYDKKLHVGDDHYFDLMSATNIQLLEVKS